MAKVETLIEKCCKSFGEGPHWDDRTGQLLFVDINDYSVHRWTASTGTREKHTFEGGYVVSIGKTICHFDWDMKQVKTLATVDEGKDTKINDGKCDAFGRLWFGTMGLELEPNVYPEERGSLYSLDLDGTVRKHKENVSISNGIAWTEDNKTMYYIDSIPRKLWAYDFDLASGTISNERVVLSFGGEETMSTFGLPDGMTVDTDGKLWVTCFLAGRVIRFDPETGKEIGEVKVPTKRTTSCCFGGKNFDEMYITCSRYGIDDEELKATPLAGSVFRATGIGARGKAAYVFQGLL